MLLLLAASGAAEALVAGTALVVIRVHLIKATLLGAALDTQAIWVT